jgi:hypothetical protein
MNKSHIAIIILVLIAVVFAVGVGAGVSRDEDEPDPAKMDGDQIKAFVEKSVPDFFKNLQESFGSHGPKLKSEDFSSPKFNDPTVLIVFSAKEPLVALIGESDEENRKGIFKLVSGGKAFITYEPKSLPTGVEDPKAKEELQGRKLELLPASDKSASCGKNDKSCAEISIFKDGGNLKFECVGDQSCKIELK